MHANGPKLHEPVVVATLSSGGIMDVISKGEVRIIMVDFQELDAGRSVSDLLDEDDLEYLQQHFPTTYAAVSEYFT
jgi:hypothetical protein